MCNVHSFPVSGKGLQSYNKFSIYASLIIKIILFPPSLSLLKLVPF